MLFAVPWIQAFIWAFRPADLVDIRRFPVEARMAVVADIARLRIATAQQQKAVAGHRAVVLAAFNPVTDIAGADPAPPD